ITVFLCLLKNNKMLIYCTKVINCYQIPFIHPISYLRSMKYFEELEHLLHIEHDEDHLQYHLQMKKNSIQARKEMGVTWFPIIIKNEELGAGDYLQIEIERPNADVPHKFRFGMPVEVFSNHPPQTDCL